MPGEALDGFSAIVGSGGRFLPLAGLEFRADPNEAEARLWPGLHFDDIRDYVMWVLGAPIGAPRELQAFAADDPVVTTGTGTVEVGKNAGRLCAAMAGPLGDRRPAAPAQAGPPDLHAASLSRSSCSAAHSEPSSRVPLL